MPGKGLIRFVLLALVLAGVLCLGLRFQARRDERVGLADSAWRLTYSIEGEAQEPGAELRVAIPSGTQHCRVFRQDFRHSNLRVDPLRGSPSETREIVAVAEHKDEWTLTLRLDLHVSPRGGWPADETPVSLTPASGAEYLAGDRGIQTGCQAVVETLADLRDEKVQHAALAERAFEHCRRQLRPGGPDAPNDAEEALQRGLATPLGRARAMIALCRASGIPARLVSGFEIRQGPIDPHVWVEVLAGNRWVPYDPSRGFSRELPHNVLPVRRGGPRIVVASDVSELESEFSMVQLPGTPRRIGAQVRRPADILDLTRLPLEMHAVVALILLMPLGALVTCVFRNIVGIETSGTFTPTLLALSFVFADWRTGLAVLAAVVVLGFTTRYFLDRLRLLLVPRLSIILTLVVCCIVFGVSLLDYLRLTPGVHAVLLPMVILTMIVERFYVTTQEDSMYVALQRLGGTAVVGFFCYLVLRWETVARLLLAYPEAHFLTVAALIGIGRYTGYRLLEPWRFRDAAEVDR